MPPIVPHADPLLPMALVGFAALTVNVPLGYLREGTRRYSLGWFVYIHLSVPLIALLRTSNRLSGWLIPLFILCAVAGQLVGGWIRRRKGTEG